ncbi:MAG: hypothetical protein AUI11_01180 [Acidobacteria bacterium 13_2_20CM_2_66_4]|nr:MAG: hypothetical protein AUI11_01180 [Acidobacteria bacterium 13_2_20CM_2_66_4]
MGEDRAARLTAGSHLELVLHLGCRVESRERWQALQARLTAARTSLESGDRERALAEVTAALDIDPSFLAAIALRDRIIGGESIAPSGVRVPLAASPAVNMSAPASPRPLVSVDGYAKFEQRARRRRVDRKIDAARTAIAHGKLREAAAAIGEIAELDPNLPELTALTSAFQAARRNRRQRHFGPWLAAAAVFGVLVLSASWLQDSHLLLSHPLNAITGLVETRAPEPIVTATIDSATIEAKPAAPVGTAGVGDRDVAPVAAERPTPPVIDAPTEPPPLVRIPPPQPRPAPPMAEPEPSPAPQPPPVVAASIPQRQPAQASELRASANSPVASAVSASAVSTIGNDEGDVKQALQRYRSAYEGLDARRARAVWPAVNEVALARAFDGLSSQTLTFDACDVQLRGEAALATCHGSARYVPKVGSREPRVEPRTWSFTLRKTGPDWKIESARAER